MLWLLLLLGQFFFGGGGESSIIWTPPQDEVISFNILSRQPPEWPLSLWPVSWEVKPRHVDPFFFTLQELVSVLASFNSILNNVSRRGENLLLPIDYLVLTKRLIIVYFEYVSRSFKISSCLKVTIHGVNLNNSRITSLK